MKRMLLAVAATAMPAVAQETQAQAPPPPGCTEKVFHDFDFWIGEWEVFDPQGVKQGDNSIAREEYGCLLVERWVDTSGGTGQSYNFYDPLAKKWRQVWVSRGAVIDYTGGLNDRGEMVLEGQIAYQRGGVVAPFRGTWTPNEDGSVRQYFQQYDEKAKTWNDWFTGIYKRKASAGE